MTDVLATPPALIPDVLSEQATVHALYADDVVQAVRITA